MAEPQPTDRLNYTGDLEPVINQLCEVYDIGASNGYTVIGTGYEDCNVIIDTDQDKYLAKMFSKDRSPDDITRYTGIMQQVVAAGINHPELVPLPDGDMVYSDRGISLVLMRFVEGETFFELGRLPNDQERREVIEQAAKINKIDYRPPYLFDSWAIPNFEAMLQGVKQHIESDDLELVMQVKQRYDAIPVDDLPHSFVHGDLIKTNLVKAKNGSIYVLDFSVANWYPRIQELAVIAANLLHDEDGGQSLKERCELIADEYDSLNPLTAAERQYLYDYALAGAAMEFLGSNKEKYINGNDSIENEYWLRLGRNGLRKAL